MRFGAKSPCVLWIPSTCVCACVGVCGSEHFFFFFFKCLRADIAVHCMHLVCGVSPFKNLSVFFPSECFCAGLCKRDSLNHKTFLGPCLLNIYGNDSKFVLMDKIYDFWYERNVEFTEGACNPHAPPSTEKPHSFDMSIHGVL